MTEEKRLERELVKRVEDNKIGGRCVKFIPDILKGFPDRICLFPGARVVFVEVKDPAKSPTPMQRYWIRILRKLDFPVYVLDKDETIELILDHANPR